MKHSLLLCLAVLLSWVPLLAQAPDSIQLLPLWKETQDKILWTIGDFSENVDSVPFTVAPNQKGYVLTLPMYPNMPMLSFFPEKKDNPEDSTVPNDSIPPVYLTTFDSTWFAELERSSQVQDFMEKELSGFYYEVQLDSLAQFVRLLNTEEIKKRSQHFGQQVQEILAQPSAIDYYQDEATSLQNDSSIVALLMGDTNFMNIASAYGKSLFIGTSSDTVLQDVPLGDTTLVVDAYLIINTRKINAHLFEVDLYQTFEYEHSDTTDHQAQRSESVLVKAQQNITMLYNQSTGWIEKSSFSVEHDVPGQNGFAFKGYNVITDIGKPNPFTDE